MIFVFIIYLKTNPKGMMKWYSVWFWIFIGGLRMRNSKSGPGRPRTKIFETFWPRTRTGTSVFENRLGVRRRGCRRSGVTWHNEFFLISPLIRNESLLRNWNPRYPKWIWLLYFANCIIKTGLLLLWKCKMFNKVFRLWCWFNSPYISTPFVLLNFLFL